MKFITLIHSIHVPAPDLNFKFLIHWQKKKQSAFLSPTSSIVSQKTIKIYMPIKNTIIERNMEALYFISNQY